MRFRQALSLVTSIFMICLAMISVAEAAENIEGTVRIESHESTPPSCALIRQRTLQYAMRMEEYAETVRKLQNKTKLSLQDRKLLLSVAERYTADPNDRIVKGRTLSVQWPLTGLNDDQFAALLSTFTDRYSSVAFRGLIWPEATGRVPLPFKIQISDLNSTERSLSASINLTNEQFCFAESSAVITAELDASTSVNFVLRYDANAAPNGSPGYKIDPNFEAIQSLTMDELVERLKRSTSRLERNWMGVNFLSKISNPRLPEVARVVSLVESNYRSAVIFRAVDIFPYTNVDDAIALLRTGPSEKHQSLLKSVVSRMLKERVTTLDIQKIVAALEDGPSKNWATGALMSRVQGLTTDQALELARPILDEIRASPDENRSSFEILLPLARNVIDPTPENFRKIRQLTSGKYLYPLSRAFSNRRSMLGMGEQ